jgi:hypothetical protein
LSEVAEAWDRTKNTRSIAALDAFIRRFGDTYYGDLAKVRLAALRQGGAAKEAANAAKKNAAEPSKRDEKARTATQLKIATWAGMVDSLDQRFYKFVEGNKDKIIRITGAATENSAKYDKLLEKCIIGHTDSDGMGTNYIVDCQWLNLEWHINGFFTQKEWLFKNGKMDIWFERVPDGVVLAQNPLMIPFGD